MAALYLAALLLVLFAESRGRRVERPSRAWVAVCWEELAELLLEPVWPLVLPVCC